MIFGSKEKVDCCSRPAASPRASGRLTFSNNKPPLRAGCFAAGLSITPFGLDFEAEESRLRRQRSAKHISNCQRFKFAAPVCAPRGTRTPDTRFRRPMLYPLSYERMTLIVTEFVAWSTGKLFIQQPLVMARGRQPNPVAQVTLDTRSTPEQTCRFVIVT
jgi:hypothetical protein